MERKEKSPTKELYQKLRHVEWGLLWNEEVPRFNQADATVRLRNVALVRAVGVVFTESGDPSQKNEVVGWLRSLLQDPAEKIRRYAMAALPKIGAGRSEEADLLDLLDRTTLERERKFLGRTLDKIGGEATLQSIDKLPPQTARKVRASVARGLAPGAIRLDQPVMDSEGRRIHLRGRRGLELFVKEEVEQTARTRKRFRIQDVRPGLVALAPIAPFTLEDLYALRCFGTLGIVLGTVTESPGRDFLRNLAETIASPRSHQLLRALTHGAIRYRLDFISKGHQRGAVREISDLVFAMAPEILNDARNAPWAVDIHPAGFRSFVELRPRLSPDPRFSYRVDDVPAASHPPLAACMARLAGSSGEDVIWDPFCGSGLELIERAGLGGVRRIYGSDLSRAAADVALRNLEAACVEAPFKIVCGDFRDFAAREGIRPGTLTQIITNPPMGRRVPIENLAGLVADLFHVASSLLRDGGCLVFANPRQVKSPDASLRLQSSQVVDFGGFDCHLERYIKTGRAGARH